MNAVSPLLIFVPALLLSQALTSRVTAAQDTLQLAALQNAAIARDARAGQPALLRSATELRLTSLEMERRPQLSLNGTLSHQSDVTAVQLAIPGVSVPVPPKDRWQSTLDAQQLLYDGGAIAARKEVERARLAESSAAVDAALYRLRAEVNGAFFSAYLLQQRIGEFEALLTDLDARLRVARARVTGGVALPRDTSALVAEQLQATVARDQAAGARRAALAVLANLTGRTIGEQAILPLPELSAVVERTQESQRPEALRIRPEFAQFDRTRVRLDRESALARMQNRPRLVAFGQAGVGRPGLNQFRPDAAGLWLAGLRVEWRPWTWRSAERSAEALRLQERVVTTEEAALAEQLARAVASDVAEMQTLRTALATDARVVQLRSDIERQAGAQYAEGVITAAEYVTTRTDVLEARLTLVRHRAELAQAEARYLTTLGLVPDGARAGAP